MTNLESYRW